MSLGRYGADESGTRKVSLEITVDKWVSDALGKIRSKKSVSSMVNGLLTTVIRQFDPGPSSPLIHELVRVLAKYRGEAEASGDTEMLASVAQLHSQLEPYIDLAEAELDSKSPSAESTDVEQGRRKDGNGGHGAIKDSPNFNPSIDRARRDYNWYAVPVLCHGTPMMYLRGSKAWKCLVCGGLCRDTWNEPPGTRARIW